MEFVRAGADAGARTLELSFSAAHNGLTAFESPALGSGAARPRVIRGTRVKLLPLLPSGPGGVYNHPLHEARSLTTLNGNIRIHLRESNTACSFSPKRVIGAGLCCGLSSGLAGVFSCAPAGRGC